MRIIWRSWRIRLIRRGRAPIDRFLGALAVAGLLHDRGQGVFEMHPALTGFLRSTRPPEASDEPGERWSRAFVDLMGTLADQLAPRELHEQRVPFFLHGANFHVALGEAERLGMDLEFKALIQSLAAHAQNTRNFQEAAHLFEQLATSGKNHGDAKIEAIAYHQLGMIAQERRDFTGAEQWYRKSLAIEEKQGDEHGAASNYHCLGMIAQEQRDFASAEQWYRKSLAIEEKQGDEHGAASTYHQLGIIAAERRDFASAEQWWHKALAIWVKYGDKHHEAITRSNLERLREAAGPGSIPEPGETESPSSRVKPPWGRFFRWVRGQLP